MESMKDIEGNDVYLGDRVAFITSGYNHKIKFRVGVVTKFRKGIYGKTVATVSYIDSNPYYDYKTQTLIKESREKKCAMQLPRLVKLGKL